MRSIRAAGRPASAFPPTRLPYKVGHAALQLGRSGLSVSRIGFGGIPIQRLSKPQAVALVRRALELGVDWLDTANGYGPSEEMIGEALGGG